MHFSFQLFHSSLQLLFKIGDAGVVSFVDSAVCGQLKEGRVSRCRKGFSCRRHGFVRLQVVTVKYQLSKSPSDAVCVVAGKDISI